MSPETDAHDALGAYLTDSLSGDELRSFEAHLEGCSFCRREVAELIPVAGTLASLAAPFDPPPDLNARVMAAVDVAAKAEGSSGSFAGETLRPERGRGSIASRMPGWPRLAGAGLAGALALAAAFVIGVSIAGNESEETVKRGVVEVDATIGSADGSVEGMLLVTAFDSGRRISFETDDLPILPKGDYYEMWFVGPGDSPSDPNRVSAGTFHPNTEGVSDVILHAAVDPALLPRVEVTKEPGNGKPGVDGPVVAELDAEGLLAEP